MKSYNKIGTFGEIELLTSMRMRDKKKFQKLLGMDDLNINLGNGINEAIDYVDDFYFRGIVNHKNFKI